MRPVSHEILPEWRDKEHEELDFAIRVYDTIKYQGTTEVKTKKVEIYRPEGIYRFELNDFVMTPDVVLGEYEP